jgi:hypothetical protein
MAGRNLARNIDVRTIIDVSRSIDVRRNVDA